MRILFYVAKRFFFSIFEYYFWFLFFSPLMGLFLFGIFFFPSSHGDFFLELHIPSPQTFMRPIINTHQHNYKPLCSVHIQNNFEMCFQPYTSYWDGKENILCCKSQNRFWALFFLRSCLFLSQNQNKFLFLFFLGWVHNLIDFSGNYFFFCSCTSCSMKQMI